MKNLNYILLVLVLIVADSALIPDHKDAPVLAPSKSVLNVQEKRTEVLPLPDTTPRRFVLTKKDTLVVDNIDIIPLVNYRTVPVLQMNCKSTVSIVDVERLISTNNLMSYDCFFNSND